MVLRGQGKLLLVPCFYSNLKSKSTETGRAYASQGLQLTDVQRDQIFHFDYSRNGKMARRRAREGDQRRRVDYRFKVISGVYRHNSNTGKGPRAYQAASQSLLWLPSALRWGG